MKQILLTLFTITAGFTFAQITTDGLQDHWTLDGVLTSEIESRPNLIALGVETCFDGNINTIAMRNDTDNFVEDRDNNADHAYRAYFKSTVDSFFCSFSGSWIKPTGLTTALETSLNYIYSNSSRTFALWAKNTSGINQRIFQAGLQENKRAFGLELKPQSNTVTLYTWGAGNDVDAIVVDQDDEWHHYAATYNGSVLKLYIDGEFVDSINITNLDTGPATTKFGGANSNTDVQIDDIRIYNRALTAEEIREFVPEDEPTDPTDPTSIRDKNQSVNIKIYPNPAKSNLNIELKEISKVEIYSITGVKLAELSGASQYQYNTSSLAAGLYFVKAGEQTMKFVKN